MEYYVALQNLLEVEISYKILKKLDLVGGLGLGKELVYNYVLVTPVGFAYYYGDGKPYLLGKAPFLSFEEFLKKHTP